MRRVGLRRASEASFEFCLSRSSSCAVSDSAVEAAELAGDVKLFREDDREKDLRKDAEWRRTMCCSNEKLPPATAQDVTGSFA